MERKQNKNPFHYNNNDVFTCLIFYCLNQRYRFYFTKLDTQYLTHYSFRLQTKLEDLEHLMNDEVTDINEAIKVINNLQVGFIVVVRFSL